MEISESTNKTIRIALAQINVTVGDLSGNVKKISKYIENAKQYHADIIAFPELTITGYPPEDLLLRPQFIQDNLMSLQQVVKQSRGITCIVGFADRVEDRLYNGAAVISDGELIGVYHKIHLPNYGVFDEKRYFKEGNQPLVFELNGIKIGLSICEDLWIADSVIDTQALIGDVEIAVNISASPYCSGKIEERENLVIDRALKNRLKMIYVNLVGGQDELVFDGSSLVVDENGKIVARCHEFAEDMLILDFNVTRIKGLRAFDQQFQERKKQFMSEYNIKRIELTKAKHKKRIEKPTLKFVQRKKLKHLDEIYQALVLGTRDYAYKNGFKKVVLGLSGGIDSALTAAIATDALGKENVIAVAMPSEFSTRSSLDDAQQLVNNLGITYNIIPIQQTFVQYREMLKPEFKDLPFDVTEENIQARIRGNIIMALSNKFGWLPLTTGNKSENSVGYCTLYGDMAGGFAVIKDVPKTLVYQLAKNLNDKGGREIIPHNTIIKPPSAELRPDQKDEDSLPPYHILDPILTEYIENNASVKQIVEKGFDETIVRKVIRLVDISEYKRRQSPPGIKITPRAFGKDRRMPITNRYR